MIVVRKIVGLATFQDLGRPGLASQGVPRGGALVRALAARANAALGNDESAACIESFGRIVLEAERDVRVATEDGIARDVRAGSDLTIEPDASLRARYIAVERGIDAPRVLGSRSALLACGIGRALRAGDRVTSCAHARSASRSPVPLDAAGPVRIILGPDDVEAGDELTRRPWRISASSDRVGTRLEGAPLVHAARAALPSSPMVPGAIQLPPAGLPIVIGPDGPTTGGYAIVAVIARADVDRFHARPLGASITFVRA